MARTTGFSGAKKRKCNNKQKEKRSAQSATATSSSPYAAAASNALSRLRSSSAARVRGSRTTGTSARSADHNSAAADTSTAGDTSSAPASLSSSRRKRKRTTAPSLPSADASALKPTDTPENLQRRYDAIRDGLLKGNADEQADMLFGILTDPNFEAARRKLGSRLLKSKEASAQSAVLDLSQEADSGVRSPSSDTSPATTPPQTAHPSVAPRYGGRPVDLTKAAVSTPVNESAFDMNRASGKKRKKLAAERKKQRMSLTIVEAIEEVGNFEEQRLALRDALGHPRVRDVASSLGHNIESQEVAAFVLKQNSRLISSISGNESKRGRGNAASQAMLNAAATLAASSPAKEGEQAPAAPSMTKVSRILGFTKETGRRKLNEGSKRRKLIHDGEEFELVKKKQGYQKVSNEIRDKNKHCEND